MRVVAFAVLLLLAVVSAEKSLREPGCFSSCFKKTDKKSDLSILKPCFIACYDKVAENQANDDTAFMLELIPEALPILQEIGLIQANVSILAKDDSVEASNSNSANPNPNATLQATANLNIRGQACTGGRLITTVPAGTRMTFTNQVQTACSYTWYSVRGSFGEGWGASTFLQEVQPGRSYPLFKQCDPRWANNRLGSSTICRIGCLMSSVSMALNGLGRAVAGQAANPGVLNAYLSSHGGYQGDLFIWGSVAPFGFKYQGQTRDKNQIHADVNAGKVVILNVRNGGHWVLAVASTGSGFTVNDPGFSVGSYTNGEVVLAGIYTV